MRHREDSGEEQSGEQACARFLYAEVEEFDGKAGEAGYVWLGALTEEMGIERMDWHIGEGDYAD